MIGTKRRRIDRLDFILAGAQKSGTTALRYFLSKHPDIAMGDQEEMHFFDNEEIFSGPVDYDLLHRHFAPVSGPTRLRHAVPRQAIAGECTPIYVYWKPAMERIWKYHPGIKLLILLRSPVDRAFAHWNMQRFKGREPLDFIDAIKKEKERAQTEAPLQSRRFSYVDRGLYSGQLDRVFKYFPREQVKIVKFERFRDNNHETLEEIFGFLGVRSMPAPRNKDRNVVPYERVITSDERRYLQRVFAEEIATLEDMLGWDCADWMAVPGD